MKRLILGLTILALLLGLTGPVAAQPQPFVSIHGNQLLSYTASQAVLNTTQARAIFSVALPMTALFATPPAANVSACVTGSDTTMSSLTCWPGGMPIPIHASLIGAVQYGSGNITVGANFGGSATGAASVVLINGYVPPGAYGSQGTGGSGTTTPVLTPIRIDCWVIPVASTPTATLGFNGAMLSCRAEMPSSQTSLLATQPVVFNQTSYASAGFNLASPQTLNIIWQWGTASLANSLTIQSATVTLGW